MSPLLLILILFGLICGLIIIKAFRKRKTTKSSIHYSTDPITTTPIPDVVDEVPSEIISEMPIKPLPVDCQKAIFRPFPEKFTYTDCCGKLQEGEGYQPWEKRAPVSIDVLKRFEGMDLIDESAEIDC